MYMYVVRLNTLNENHIILFYASTIAFSLPFFLSNYNTRVQRIDKPGRHCRDLELVCVIDIPESEATVQCLVNDETAVIGFPLESEAEALKKRAKNLHGIDEHGDVSCHWNEVGPAGARLVGKSTLS